MSTNNLTLEQRLELLGQQKAELSLNLAKIDGAIETIQDIINQVRSHQQATAEKLSANVEKEISDHWKNDAKKPIPATAPKKRAKLKGT